MRPSSSAAGPTGNKLTEQALAAGHEVIAVGRRPGSIQDRPASPWLTADVTDRRRERAVAGSDAVCPAWGPADPPSINRVLQGNANIVAAMHRYAVKRLVTVSSSVSGSHLRPSGEFSFNNVMDPLVNRRLGRTAHQDMRRMEALVRASDLDWTIARPSGLFDHPSVTRYDLARTSLTACSPLVRSRASMLAQLTDDGVSSGGPCGDHHRSTTSIIV